jgi:hypothetical protein
MLMIPERPTRPDAEQAFRLLRHAYRTFPPADRVTTREVFSIHNKSARIDVVDLRLPPGKDESGLLVMQVSAVAASSIERTPIGCVRAPRGSGSGAGKGLAVNAMNMVAFGRTPNTITPGTREEKEKSIIAMLIDPGPAGAIDNFNERQLYSPALNMWATERASFRILGSLKQANTSPRKFITVTGNAFTIAEDLTRRCQLCEFDPRHEFPAQRRFPEGFLASVRAHRSELLSAVLTIVRWGVQNPGELTHGKPLGGYEQWCKWVRDPMLTLGCQDPVERLSEIIEDDPVHSGNAAVFRLWWQHHRDTPITQYDLHAEVKSAIVRDPDKDDKGRRLQSRLRHLKNSIAGGYQLVVLLERKDDAYQYQLKRIKAPEPSRQSDMFDDDAGPAASTEQPENPEPYDPRDDGCSDEVEPEQQQQHEASETAPPPPSEQTDVEQPRPLPRDAFGQVRQPPMKDGVLQFGMDRQRSRGNGQRKLAVLGPAPAEAVCVQCERSDGEILRISAGPEDINHLHRHCAEVWFAGVRVRGAFDPSDERSTKSWAPATDGSAAWVENQVEALRVLDKLQALPDEPPAGYASARQWQLARAAMIKFASTDHAFGNLLAQALSVGWTLAELFAISADPAVGVKAIDLCGAMLVNGRGATVTHVDEHALHFSDGLVVRKRPVAPGACLIWDVNNK